MGRFINADGYASTGQGLLGNNMFAYCNNNPVMHSDPSGETLIGAMIGGAIGGALIGAVSHITTNPNATTGSTLLALGTGALTGALGGLAGSVEVAKGIISVGAGIVAGIYAGATTSGSLEQKILTGVVTGSLATFSTYAGAQIDTSGFDRFGTAVANYATTILVGSFAEPITVAAQQQIATRDCSSANNRSNTRSNDRWNWARNKQEAILGI